MSTQLTARQREIKVRLEKGMSVREVADDLGVSPNAVHQQIQRMRRNGDLPSNFTASGQPTRELTPGADMLARLVYDQSDRPDVELAGALALVQELKLVRDELDTIARRISAILPR